MSGERPSEPPPTDGVVRNSALAFLAQAQGPSSMPGPPMNLPPEAAQSVPVPERVVPAGVKALCEACLRVYPEQPNPLQVTTRLKYWLGGSDPLDYISMYYNPGDPQINVPPHWHYVSFGLSDLHGDGRVHPPPGPSGPSGAGFELTFRLKADLTVTPTTPPLWPAALLQASARYVFATGNKFCAGDHISWHAALDGGAGSRIKHMLVASDPQIQPATAEYGTVSFLQLVGCTERELRAAQRKSGNEVLEIMQAAPNCGGRWLVTDMSRRRSAVGRGGGGGGGGGAAHLAGVSTAVRWAAERHAIKEEKPETSPETLSSMVQQQIKETLKRGLNNMSGKTEKSASAMSTDSFEMSSIERALPEIPELMQGSWRSTDGTEPEVEYFPAIHITISAEGAALLPLAIDGRVLHGRHFTWRSTNACVTLVGKGVVGSYATVENPYAAKGDWLQVLITKELATDMSRRLSLLSNLETADSESDDESEKPSDKTTISLPYTFSWPERGFYITIVQDQFLL